MQIRVSTIESFRRVLLTEYGDEAALIEYIRAGQEGKPNWKMRAGTAWHMILAGDRNPVDDADMIHEDGFAFDVEAADAAVAHIGPGIPELTGYWPINSGVEIKGTCDLINGLTISDHKTKFSTIDARDYENSLQWKFYLTIFGANCFRYNLFHFKDPADAIGDEPCGYCELMNIVSFNFWRYRGMEAECFEWVDRFCLWASDRGLLGCLDTTEQRRAA